MLYISEGLCDIVCGDRKLVASDRYQAYVQNSVLGSNPVELITALYEGAIEATQQAERCLEAGDIWGRSKAISKAANILTELLVSLNDEKGGKLSLNLKRLYAYMHTRLIEAHAKQSAEPLREVARLLNKLLDAWRVVAAKTAEADRQAAAELKGYQPRSVAQGGDAMPYGGYFYEPVDPFSRVAATF